MLTEQSAYTNRWRWVSPTAKGIFTCSGLVAACAATSPRASLLVITLLMATAIFGAGIPITRYLRVGAPAMLFLGASCLSLLVTLNFGSGGSPLTLQSNPDELSRIVHICGRSCACLAALLLLTLTTPLSDIISLLRRCRVPDTLLDLMTLCYRTLFVLSAAIHETLTAQSARLGHSTVSLSLRSLGGLVANLTIQVWQRSQALHIAALARNNDGALRFLEYPFARSARHTTLASGAGITLILLAVLIP